MELDLKMLAQKLLEAQATPPADLPVVSDYVIQAIDSITDPVHFVLTLMEVQSWQKRNVQ